VRSHPTCFTTWVMGMNEGENNVPRPWKYTDDIIAGIIVVAYIIGKFIGVQIPENLVGLALGYVFGKNVPSVISWLKK